MSSKINSNNKIEAPVAKNDVMQRLEQITGKRFDVSAAQMGVVYFIIDRSESMTGESIHQAKEGISQFASEVIDNGYAIGLIAFSNTATLFMEPAKSKTMLNQALQSINCSGGTDMLDAFNMAINKLNNIIGKRIVCIATDGATNHQYEIIESAQKAHAKNITIMAINIEGADQAFLDKIVSQKEFSVKVERHNIQIGIASMAKLLSANKRF